MPHMGNDESIMLDCIKLANEAASKGELPFGSILVCASGEIFESSNSVVTNNNVIEHAEMNVIREAQGKYGNDLSGSTLYSNCEPCAMCSFMICELNISKVIYGVSSPEMGGASRWNILDNPRPLLSKYGFSKPVVVSGFMEAEASKSFIQFNRQLPGLPWAKGK